MEKPGRGVKAQAAQIRTLPWSGLPGQQRGWQGRCSHVSACAPALGKPLARYAAEAARSNIKKALAAVRIKEMQEALGRLEGQLVPLSYPGMARQAGGDDADAAFARGAPGRAAGSDDRTMDKYVGPQRFHDPGLQMQVGLFVGDELQMLGPNAQCDLTAGKGVELLADCPQARSLGQRHSIAAFFDLAGQEIHGR